MADQWESPEHRLAQALKLLRPFAAVGLKLRNGEARPEALEVVVALMLGAADFERAADLLYPEERTP